MASCLIALGTLTDKTTIVIEFIPLKTIVRARGGQAALTELCQQLAWLGSALRSPLSSRLPVQAWTWDALTIVRDSDSPKEEPIRWSLSFQVLCDWPLNPVRLYGTCWHNMFHSPVIAYNFPIRARDNGARGLEVPFDMMIKLAEAQFATPYDGTLVLKGLCTLLVPTLQTEEFVNWHFMHTSGKRIPYHAFRKAGKEFVSITALGISQLQSGGFRNFVGWASDITRHLGQSLSFVFELFRLISGKVRMT